MTAPTPLPYDLERTILEYAAEVDQPMALKLLLVSREVKRWIEPILYRHVKLTNTAQADAFIRTLDVLHTRSPFSLSNTVKSISFTYCVTFHQAAKILAACTNITSLSSKIELSRKTLDITLDDIQDFRDFMFTSTPALRRLSVAMQPFFLCPDPNFRVPILQNLTQLSIFGSSEICHRWSWTGLDTLKHLTHFALEIDTSTPLQVIYNLIPRLPTPLRVCLVVLSVKPNGMLLREYLKDKHEVEQLICGDTDHRIAVGTTEPPEALDSVTASCARKVIPMSRWEDLMADRVEWEKAEEVIQSRKRKAYTRELD